MSGPQKPLGADGLGAARREVRALPPRDPSMIAPRAAMSGQGPYSAAVSRSIRTGMLPMRGRPVTGS
jgi:hypothetical protein